MAAVDASGMAVSLTTSTLVIMNWLERVVQVFIAVNLFWGSRVMTPDGVILNGWLVILESLCLI